MNKYFCVALTFWQYIKIGFKEFFSSKEPVVYERWTLKVITTLVSFLVGLVIASLILWLVEFFDIMKIFSNLCLGFFVFAFVVDAIALIVFLFVSWRKAVNDCWDKFQAG